MKMRGNEIIDELLNAKPLNYEEIKQNSIQIAKGEKVMEKRKKHKKISDGILSTENTSRYVEVDVNKATPYKPKIFLKIVSVCACLAIVATAVFYFTNLDKNMLKGESEPSPHNNLSVPAPTSGGEMKIDFTSNDGTYRYNGFNAPDVDGNPSNVFMTTETITNLTAKYASIDPKDPNGLPVMVGGFARSFLLRSRTELNDLLSNYDVLERKITTYDETGVTGTYTSLPDENFTDYSQYTDEWFEDNVLLLYEFTDSTTPRLKFSSIVKVSDGENTDYVLFLDNHEGRYPADAVLLSYTLNIEVPKKMLEKYAFELAGVYDNVELREDFVLEYPNKYKSNLMTTLDYGLGEMYLDRSLPSFSGGGHNNACLDNVYHNVYPETEQQFYTYWLYPNGDFCHTTCEIRETQPVQRIVKKAFLNGKEVTATKDSVRDKIKVGMTMGEVHKILGWDNIELPATASQNNQTTAIFSEDYKSFLVVLLYNEDSDGGISENSILTKIVPYDGYEGVEITVD
jgi:hypothetical protein